MSTVAGTGEPGYSGDNGPAINARLNQPYDIALDSQGNLYIADMVNHCIRKVDPEGIISTIAGSGVAGFSGDNGPALMASLRSPVDVAVHNDGTLYIADKDNNRIRKVDAQGTSMRPRKPRRNATETGLFSLRTTTRRVSAKSLSSNR